MIKIKSRLKEKKIRIDTLHLDGGVLARSKYCNSVVLFTGRREGIVVVAVPGGTLLQKVKEVTPYYDKNHWEILPSDSEVDLEIEQKQ